jgi:glucose-1-phosphatase
MKLNPSFFSNPKSEIRNPKSIKNIIFDFGGVICNIDVKLTEKAFMDLGLKQFDTGRSISESAGLFEDLETGTISPQHFRDELKKYFVNPVTDEQIDTAWNALLLDIPEPRIRLIEKVRQQYRIFLLSNTNEIHYRCYLERFRKQYGYTDFDALFEKAWLSHRIGLKKPSTEIFNYVMQHSALEPSETLFIDDTLRHVEGARKAGLHAHHLAIGEGEQIMDLFL